MNRKSRFFPPLPVNQRGMTLVEVIVVITVAGILAAVAAPTVSNALQRERARGFAHEVANKLREARNQAQARGEALVVYVGHDLVGDTPGDIMVFRTSKRMSDGTFGGAVCDTETEGISTFDCPADAICMNNTCQGVPARSCRELDFNPSLANVSVPGGGDVQYTRVVNENFNENAEGGMSIRLAWAKGGSYFCMSPRGTVERLGGRMIQPEWVGIWSCADEGFNIWVSGDEDPSVVNVINGMRCDSTVVDYERVEGHVVRVMPNGEIGLRPPSKP